jgi:uncharacterized membrane protein
MNLAPLRSKNRHGQVIVLVAFLMVFIVGVLGLVVDVGGAYSRQRFERSVADSASLSGAQELQTATRGSPPTGAHVVLRLDFGTSAYVREPRWVRSAEVGSSYGPPA